LQHLFTKSDLLFVIIIVVIAGITKSAQIPFSAWLPAAMAAPTPVSSLVHSSTLVTAGVYLLIRFNYIIGINEALFSTGVFTIFISGLGANFEIDLKKIIALSTLSQLGLIIITLSMGFYELSFFHLMTHAIFKSLLFLCAGVFIHSMGDTQDIRLIGGLYISCPVTRFYFIGSSLALCGFPFLSGFYSKDLILEVYFILNINLIMYVSIFMSTIFTLTYSVRLVYYIFFNAMGYKTFLSIEEERGIFIPMSFLFISSIYAGGVLSSFIFPLVCVSLPASVKISVLVILLVLSILVYLNMNLKTPGVMRHRKAVVNYIGSIWFLPALSSIMFMPVLKLGQLFLKLMDQGWLEFIGGQGAISKFKGYSIYLDTFNLINIKSYLLVFFFLRSFLFLLVI
jgi:NADH-ubiquinone oxidoreductase chain 5